MDRLTTEQNFQLAQAIDLIDYPADEILNSTDSEAVFDSAVYSSYSWHGFQEGKP